MTAPVAQLDRVTGFELVGRGFESLRARRVFAFVILLQLMQSHTNRVQLTFKISCNSLLG